MDAWISLLSYFSGELLVFELLGVFSLLAMFFVFLFARKRRYPDSTVVVPAQLFHESIDQLINEAETLKAQIFGKGTARLKTAPIQRIVETVTSAVTSTGPDRSAEIEALNAQIANLKAQNESLLQQAAAAGAAGGAAVDPNKPSSVIIKEALKSAEAAGADPELIKKIKVLEERLEEYSVIEDDLANLKRLQQENAQLKAQLAAGGGATVAVAAAAPVVAAVAPAPAVKTPEPVVAAPEPAAAAPVDPQAAVDALLAAGAPSGASVNPNPTAEVPAAVAAAPVEAAPPGGGDEDLLAEFEKILNS